MQTVIILIGIPGSGKTTLSRKLKLVNGFAYLCPDYIRKRLTGREDNFTREENIWKIFDQFLGYILRKGRNIIIDSTSADRRYRKERNEQIHEIKQDIRIIGVYLHISLEVALKNNMSRERQANENFIRLAHTNLSSEPPNSDDGFDEFVEIKMNDGENMEEFIDRVELIVLEITEGRENENLQK